MRIIILHNINLTKKKKMTKGIKLYLLYPRKAGILWITHGHRPQRFSCVQPTSHISFRIYFKLCKWLTMAEIGPPYCFGMPGVKIRLWGVKNCLCSSCSTVSFRFILYLVHELVGVTSRHPIFSCRPRVKIKRVIAILSPGVKIVLWGVKNINNFHL